MAAAKKKAGASSTVTLKHLAAAVAEQHEMAKKHSEAVLTSMIDLGILVVRKRAARMGRNPATGEPIKIKASKKVAFRAAKDLKEAI